MTAVLECLFLSVGYLPAILFDLAILGILTDLAVQFTSSIMSTFRHHAPFPRRPGGTPR